jgi:hypothetical protein
MRRVAARQPFQSLRVCPYVKYSGTGDLRPASVSRRIGSGRRTCDAVKLSRALPKDVSPTLQERAWTSAIWYTPT